VPKPLWTTVAVRIDENQYLANVDRLVFLLRWFRGDAPPEAIFLDPATGGALRGPDSVHWDGFPLQQAIDAASKKSMRSSAVRRRSGTALDRVQRCDSWTAARPTPRSASSVPPEPQPTGRVPHWSDLRVWSDGQEREVLVLDEQGQLTELFRWKRGRPTPGMWFVDITTGAALTDPAAVSWADFPEPRITGSG
jgi:hypothetical protein